MSPKNGIDAMSVPQKAIYRYEWRINVCDVEEESSNVNGKFQVGDEVWVKPPNCRCTTKWNRGTITKVNTENNLEVDGMARHILDVRKVFKEDSPVEEAVVKGIGEETEHINEVSSRSYPDRRRNPPRWLEEYETS